NGGQRNGLALRTFAGDVDVVHAFKRQRHGQIQLDDDLTRLLYEACGIAHGTRRYDAAVFADGHGLHDRDVDRVEMTATQLFHRLGQVLVGEHHTAGINILP